MSQPGPHAHAGDAHGITLWAVRVLRQKHLQSKKFKQQQAGLDGVTRDAYAKAAAFAAKAEEEAAEAAEAQKELARAEASAEEEAAEAAEAAAQAKEALRLAQELEHRLS